MAQKKKIKQYIEESGEHIKQRSVEVAKETFTVLSKDIISQLTGKEQEKEPKNFTPFNDDVRKKMGENFSSQDSGDLDKVREQLADHNQPDALKEQLKQQRFNQFKQEEKRTYEELKAEEQQRKRKIEEEEERRRQEEAHRRQATGPIDEPQAKETRGNLFGKKKRKRSMPQQTIENQASQGKQ